MRNQDDSNTPRKAILYTIPSIRYKSIRNPQLDDIHRIDRRPFFLSPPATVVGPKNVKLDPVKNSDHFSPGAQS